MQSYSLVKALQCRCKCKRAKALWKNTTKMWYWRNWEKRLSETTQSRVSDMSNFNMIMPQPICLPLSAIVIFCCKKRMKQFYYTLFIHQTLPLATSSLFQNWKPSSLERDIGPDRHLDLPYTILVPNTSIPKSAYCDAFWKGDSSTEIIYF